MKSFKNYGIFLICLSLLAFSQNQSMEDIIKEEQQKMNAMQNEDSEYFQEIEEKYRHYEASVTQEYERVEEQARQELEEIKKKILEKWDELGLKTNKKYVDYDQDFNSKGEIDFEKGQVKASAVVEKGDPEAERKAKQMLKERLKNLVKTKGEDKKSLLEGQIKSQKDKKIDEDNVEEFADKTVEQKAGKQKEFKSGDGKQRIKYEVTVKMVPDHIQVRANRFKQEVLQQADQFDVDPALVMAIIHTESSFNPEARSYIPAYGLMQLVPKTGARDAYNYIYNRDRFLTSNYLYNPSNNIKLGCAYLAKLRFVYFKNIQNSDNALYCVIASYNGGIGTVAKTISGNTRLGTMSRVVNTHDPQWTYSKLSNDLPYDETRNYLKKVSKRLDMYDGWM